MPRNREATGGPCYNIILYTIIIYCCATIRYHYTLYYYGPRRPFGRSRGKWDVSGAWWGMAIELVCFWGVFAPWIGAALRQVPRRVHAHCNDVSLAEKVPLGRCELPTSKDCIRRTGTHSAPFCRSRDVWAVQGAVWGAVYSAAEVPRRRGGGCGTAVERMCVGRPFVPGVVSFLQSSLARF